MYLNDRRRCVFYTKRVRAKTFHKIIHKYIYKYLHVIIMYDTPRLIILPDMYFLRLHALIRCWHTILLYTPLLHPPPPRRSVWFLCFFSANPFNWCYVRPSERILAVCYLLGWCTPTRVRINVVGVSVVEGWRMVWGVLSVNWRFNCLLYPW